MSCACTDTDNWEEIRATSRRVLGEELAVLLEEYRAAGTARSSLIAILHRVQHDFGYLGASQLDAVSQLGQIPRAAVTGVATFYHYFRMQPRGTHVINCCLGTACYVRGGDKIAERLQRELGIGFGETTKDGLFTLEATRCLGTCGIAPVIMVGEQVQGPITPDKVPSLIETLVSAGDRREYGDDVSAVDRAGPNR